MTNEEIVEEARHVKEMNWREEERARMTPEEIAVQQRANELVLRIGQIGDNETMFPIFKEALMNERRIAIEEEREACAKIAHDEAMKWGVDLNGRTAGLHIEGEIRARSS